jgi:hypothetical protein
MMWVAFFSGAWLITYKYLAARTAPNRRRRSLVWEVRGILTRHREQRRQRAGTSPWPAEGMRQRERVGAGSNGGEW